MFHASKTNISRAPGLILFARSPSSRPTGLSVLPHCLQPHPPRSDLPITQHTDSAATLAAPSAEKPGSSTDAVVAGAAKTGRQQKFLDRFPRPTWTRCDNAVHKGHALLLQHDMGCCGFTTVSRQPTQCHRDGFAPPLPGLLNSQFADPENAVRLISSSTPPLRRRSRPCGPMGRRGRAVIMNVTALFIGCHQPAEWSNFCG
ncbi:hypothetical protein FN846DRAFT_921284 [Sphaerosporella brunnea]|uniref:Uncharacterized protein n=1 Tax=Sphaerosporella brunnea TaxID=1250544 RepID=A0A5J5EPM5_9PEZI|nr:hypothetical protein FN846DRAFT_921284 [Sphaerosporella brunnea]